MADIALFFDGQTGFYDNKIADGDLMSANPLDTAVLISLFTWARASEEEVEENAPKYGWWGDKVDADNQDSTGSKLYLLRREKITDETIEKAKEYIRQALQWMIEDGVVSEININTIRNSANNERVDAIVTLKRGNNIRAMRFNDLWASL